MAVLSIGQVWAGWGKATSIAVGDIVVLVNETDAKELTSISSTSTKYGIGSNFSSTPAGTMAFEVVEGNTSGSVAFKNGTNYLYWTSGNSLNVNNQLSDKTSWNVTFNNGNAVIKNVNDNSRVIYWNHSSPRFACYTSKGSNYDIQLYKQTSSGKPNLSMSPSADASFVGSQEITLSTTTEGASIYYTLNGTTPTSASTKYNAAFTITETKTVKAIAIKDSESSDVISRTFTKLTPQTISDIMPSTTTEGAEFLLNDVTVTYVNGNNVYVKDASGYMLIYSSISGASNGKVLQGLQGKAKLFNGLPEISTVTKAPTVNEGTAVDPEDLTAYPTDADLNMYVTLEEVTFAAAATLSGSVTNVTGIFDGQDLVFRNAFKLSGVSLATETNYRVVGVVQKYVTNQATTYQVYPISFEEMVEEGAPEAPTFSPVAGTYTEVQNVTISCTTDDVTIYYTTDGTTPTTTSSVYSSAISVGTDMTINAIAVKNDKTSALATAAYTINLPLPEHTFQVTHNFASFEFPTGWSQSYEEHTLTYTDDNVVFESANKPQAGSAIEDRPVTKDKAISLVLTNSHKLISAVRFDYAQWGIKEQTLTMKYSTDGGENYNDFDPAVSSSKFVLQVLDMPENVNAIQVTGANSNSQVGLTSIAFDLEDKPVVTKTVNITTPENGTLTVMNGEDAVSSGDEIEVNSVLTITATPAEGYKLTEVTVNGSAYAESTLTLTENVTIAASFEENLADPVNSYVLSVLGTDNPQSVSGLRVGDKVNLPSSATECSKTFRGWTTKADFADGDESLNSYYAAGAEYTLELDNKLYAVYATPDDNAATELFATTSLGSTNTVTEGYAVSAVASAQNGYYQDGGSVGNKRHVQVMVSNTETQIIPAQPSAITVTATIGGGSTNTLTNPVYAVLLNASGEEIGDAVVMTSEIEVAGGKEYSENLPVSNFADVRGVRIYHIKENKGGQGYNVRYYAISLSYAASSYSDYSTDCAPAPVTLESVAISGTASVKEYTAGDVFNPAGLVVTGTYSDASTAPITEGISWTFDPATLSTTDESVSVTATVSGKTSAAFVVEGLTVSGAAPTPLPDAEAMVIVVEYNSNFYAMSTTPKNTTGFEPIAVTKENGKVIVTSDEDAAAIQWQIALGTSAATFQNGDGKYLACSTESNTALVLLDDASTWDKVTDPASCYKQVGKDSNDRTFYYNYNNGNPIFRAYTVNGIGADGYSGAPEFISADKIEVQIPDPKIDPELAFDPTEVELTLGETFTAPVLSYADGFDGQALITYSSSKPAVAEVDPATGAVTINLHGTAVITASFVGNENYDEDEASYTITVNKPTPTPTSTTYTKVTATEDITDGEYLIVYEGDNTHASVAFDGALATLDAASNNVAVTISEGVIAGNTEIDAAVFTIAAKEGGYSIKSGSNKYIGHTSYANGLTPSDEDTYTNTISFDEDGNAIVGITYTGGTITLRYNYASDNLRFRYYKSGQQPIALYKKGTPEPVLNWEDGRTELTVGKYYTICLPKKVTHFRGATIWDLKKRNTTGTEVYLEEAELPFAAGTPFIIQATATTLEVVYEGDATSTPVENGALRGTLTGLDVDAFAGLTGNIYILKENAIRPRTAGNWLSANRAYIDYDELIEVSEAPLPAPGRRVVAMPMQGQTATGIDALNAGEAPVKMIIDGQLFILRGEKMYDTTGRLVK